MGNHTKLYNIAKTLYNNVHHILKLSQIVDLNDSKFEHVAELLKFIEGILKGIRR